MEPDASAMISEIENLPPELKAQRLSDVVDDLTNQLELTSNPDTPIAGASAELRDEDRPS
ncbi:MAG: hypothetical protein ABR507_00375 [Actinomycetota bacterium]